LTTKLKVLLDEAITDILANVIQDYSSLLSVKYVREMPAFKGTNDPPLLKYADEEDRVLITVDTDFNHRDFPPCTHKGIIRITTRNKHEAIQGGVLRRFLQSGHRVEVRNCVAYVSDGQAIIHTHGGVETYRF
jgi:predicted nuclease of predicted toxin-antitoxin system